MVLLFFALALVILSAVCLARYKVSNSIGLANVWKDRSEISLFIAVAVIFSYIVISTTATVPHDMFMCR